MKAHEIQALGIVAGAPMQAAMGSLREAFASGLDVAGVESRLRAIVDAPADHVDDPIFGEVARAMSHVEPSFVERDAPAPWRQWGADLDAGSIEQMGHACRLPVAVAGALMPDAHRGYGLPIGGVLATDNSVIPYAVGVDIACRMKLTVVDVPAEAIDNDADRLSEVLEAETAFGIGASFETPRDHAVMDDAAWGDSDLLRRLRGKARAQLGSSGSGNHFVEWGTLTLEAPDLGLQPGTYLALLSHSGSRGPGAAVAAHYSKLASTRHPELPDALRHLAWLDLDDADGQAYWAAMELMGRYASANHDVIHREVVAALGAEVRVQIENHHNYCIPGDQLIPTPKGPVRMDTLRAGDRVYAFDESDGLVETRVAKHWQSGIKQVLCIETQNRRVFCTADHPVLTIDVSMAPHPDRAWMNKRVGAFRWREAGTLEKGDIVVCAESYYARNGDMDLDTARFCGAFVADGWVRQKVNPQGYDVGLAIGGADEAHTQRYKQLLERIFDGDRDPEVWRNNAKGAFGLTCTSKSVHQKICSMGLGGLSRDARVPEAIFQATRAAKLAFLSGYIDGDGSVSRNPKNAGRACVSSVSEDLTRQIRELAISCGLQVANLTSAEVETNFARTTSHRCVFSADATAQLTLWHPGKASAQRTTRYRRPQGLQRSAIGFLTMPRGTFAQRVRGVRSGGEETVYDLTVEHPSHSFVCEGVVVHNCWREIHEGREVYVHRKGATPAGKGVLGVIPGSMASPGYVVRGRGSAAAMDSASHGAGRVMSRRAAHRTLEWGDVRQQLADKRVRLLSAGLDEAPFVYKDIDEVMGHQRDLVDGVARFDPRIVKMAPPGEPAED